MNHQVKVFAVIRADISEGCELHSPVHNVVVKEVVLTKMEAEKEVERLMKLNSEKGCIYWYGQTRITGLLMELVQRIES